MMKTIIDIQNIHKSHGLGEGFSLHVQDFHVARGELVALVGPSGCGKSTALDILSTALEPQLEANSIFSFCPLDMPLDIVTLWKKGQQGTLAQLRQKHIGYILQTGGLLPFLNGLENIALCCTQKQHREYLEQLAEQLDISHLLQKKPAQMSVGERQRFAIARALIHEPQLILADEPVASLDPYNAQMVLELFTSIAREKQISVVMVSHFPDTAKAAGFRLVSTKVTREEGRIYAHLSDINIQESPPKPVTIRGIAPVGSLGKGSGTC